MRVKKTYSTKQRTQLIEFFKQHENECFSARDIINDDSLKIGEATVYRLLSYLALEGKLKRFSLDRDSGSVYQYNTTNNCLNHFHLKCLKCGEILCMECEFLDGMGLHIQNEHHFNVDNSKTVIYGVCNECK